MPPAAKSAEAATEEIARRYFAAVGARDVEGMVACWKSGSLDRLHGPQSAAWDQAENRLHTQKALLACIVR